MTIFVFTELGGADVLGKARELADASGDRVVAFTSKISPEDTQRLIYLGADEVLTCEIHSWNEWASLIRDQIEADANSKIILFPSNISCNVLMGEIYSRGAGKFAPMLDQADLLDVDSASKTFHGMAIQKNFSSGKVALCSLRISSLSPPFEDSSRFGKTRRVEWNGPRLEEALLARTALSSSDGLTVLLGHTLDDATRLLGEKFAKRNGGRSQKYSGKVDVVYGPCIAIEVDAKLRDLPEFQRELISISKTSLPINSISDSSIITEDLDAVLRYLVSN